MPTPPFTISSRAINLIVEISAMIERYAIRLEQKDGLLLRRANRIKTIHSLLAIEGNNLSEDEVRDVINGKTIVAPLREIQEICNALESHQKEHIITSGVGINVGTNVGIKSEQFDKILSLIRQNPRVLVREMAFMLKISSRQCERLVSEMKAQGLIKREGANKNGSWVVLKQ